MRLVCLINLLARERASLGEYSLLKTVIYCLARSWEDVSGGQNVEEKLASLGDLESTRIQVFHVIIILVLTVCCSLRQAVDGQKAASFAHDN